MTTAGPWSVKGIDPRARELAKDLARRSGMTLGEWLNQMIIEGEEDVEVPPPPPPPSSVLRREMRAEPRLEVRYEPRASRREEARAREESRTPPREIRLSSDAELKRIARALDTLTVRMEAAEHRSTLAISGIDQSVMGVLSRIEGVERDRNAVAARFDTEIDEVRAAQDRVADRLQRLSEDEAPKLQAMRALEGALGKIAERIHDGEAKAKAVAEDVRRDVDHATRRVDRVESRIEALPESQLVDAVISRLDERMAAAEGVTATAMRSLEASFAGLDQRLRTTETAQHEISRFEKLAADLNDRIETNRTELAQRLDEAGDGKLDRMEAALRSLADNVEQGERRSAEAIDQMGREVMKVAESLGERVASVEMRSAKVADHMGGEVARIADAMENRMAQADQVQAAALEKLSGEIGKIAERLADRIANSERRSAVAIDDVGEQISRVTERISGRYEAGQAALGERLRLSEERTARFLEEARDTIDRRLTEAQLRFEEAAVHTYPVIEDKEDHLFSADPFGGSDMPAHNVADPVAHDIIYDAADEEPFAGVNEPEPTFEADPLEDAFAPLSDYDLLHKPIIIEPAPADAPALAASGPTSTRDVVAAARAATRQALEEQQAAAAARPKREALSRIPDLDGSVAAPELEAEPTTGFSFGLRGRKKKEQAVTLRTMMVASGTAAALAVTAVGATLYLGAESGGRDHVDRSSPAPTAARNDDAKPNLAQATSTPPISGPAPSPASSPPGKADLMAMAVAPAPGETTGLKLPPTAKPGAKTPTPAAGAVAEKGASPQALYNLAVGRLQSGDVKGVEDLTKAANLGSIAAQFYLAKLYEQGGSGIKKDLGEARRWTERAAQGGDAKAMHNLALYAFNGEGGPRDQSEASRWFKKAAEQGVVDSQYNLARLYENGGYGVTQNKAEAYKWYMVAASQGDRDAKAAAEALKAQLPADQQGAAERSALAFHPGKTTSAETAKAQ